MLTADEIKRKLSDRNLMEICRRTGLSYNVVFHFVKDGGTNPAYKTLGILSDYLERDHPTEPTKKSEE